MNNIKRTLMEANRYEEVKDILINICTNSSLLPLSCPVNAFVDENGVTQWRVNGDAVHKEACGLLNIIEDDDLVYDDINLSSYSNLLQYVLSKSDMMIHNYAVFISHRDTPVDDMEVIRNWEILQNLILNLADKDWDIPDGWKKIYSDESSIQTEKKSNTKMSNEFEQLISTFEDMANRGTLLTGSNVSQEDLLSQIIGTIVKVSRNNSLGGKQE